MSERFYYSAEYGVPGNKNRFMNVPKDLRQNQWSGEFGLLLKPENNLISYYN